jgi:hypothetical protein
MHNIRSFTVIGLAILIFAVPRAADAQSASESPVRSSPAYAEVLLRSVELQSELDSLIDDYTESHPKIVDLRLEIFELEKASKRLLAVRPALAGKLTLALGKLLVRKAELDAEVARLNKTRTPNNNQLKRARKQADTYDAAVKEILQ